MLSKSAFQESRPEARKTVAEKDAGPEIGSLWRATAPVFRGGSVVEGEVETDVAVVGGGVAGLSTALHLHERGVAALVLEAGQPGSAATGASGGILAPDFARDGIARAMRRYGRTRGERLARLVGNSAAFTFDLIARYGIDCDGQQSGFLSPAATAGELDALRADYRAWKSLGLPVRYLDDRETREAIGTDIYGGALHFESGGALNPLAYAVGLANALHASGVPVFTDSAVRNVERDGRGWRLSLRNACVRAKRVVLAANGGNSTLHHSLRKGTMPLSVYEYSTPPLSEEARLRHFGRGLPYTDRKTYVFTGRLDPQGRLISALPEVIPAWSRDDFLREAARRVRDVYSIPLPTIEFAWRGIAYLNSSLLPVVYQPEDDLTMLAIQACNGRGLCVNSIVGSEVAALLAEGDREAMAVPLVPPKPVPVHVLASRAPRIVMSLARWKDRFRRA